MDTSNPHNLNRPLPVPAERRFGVRVTMPARDPLRRVLGDDWHREHWFATPGERDEALRELGKRHPFNRPGDLPSIRLEAIER